MGGSVVHFLPPHIDAGTKFLALYLCDLALTNVIPIFGAFFVPWVRRHTVAFDCCCTSNKRDADNADSLRTEFNISDETLQLGYRQLVLYLGVIVCPFMGFAVVAGGLLEYALSRLLMLRLTQKPRHITEAFGGLLFGALIGVAVSSLVFYPNGYLWLLYAPQAVPNGYRYNYNLDVRLPNGTDLHFFIDALHGCAMWDAISQI